MRNKERSKLAKEKEAAFLLAFYGKDSKTRFDRRASAIAAGCTPRMALWNANRILEKYKETGFRECAETLGINNANLAVMFQGILETSEGKDAISALRLALANRGETTDGASSQKPPVVNMPVMVIVGATEERLEALRRGGGPQIAETDDHALELPAPDEDAIDVEATTEQSASAQEPKPPAEDTRRLKPGDFAGPNRGDVGSLRQK